MFSKSTYDKKQRLAAEKARKAKWRGDTVAPSQKERRLMRVYGKTRFVVCCCSVAGAVGPVPRHHELAHPQRRPRTRLS